MDMETKELLGQLKGEFEGSFKEYNERREAEVKELREETGETKAALGKVQDALDAIELKLKDKSEARIEAGDEDEKGSQMAAFKSWIATGREVKGMVVSDDSEGGFLAPAEMLGDILKGIVEMSEMRGLATVRGTSKRAVTQPKRTGLASAEWVGEVEQRNDTANPTLGMDEIPVHEMHATITVSRTDLDDTEFDLEGWLRAEMAEQFAVLEGVAFLSGNGVKKPHGFLVNSDIEQVALGNSSALTADGIIDLCYSLKTGYAANATWLLNRLAIRDIRKLKETGTDNYLWQPGLSASAPANILGYPYREVPDMPEVGANALALAFGDWAKGYTIVDRQAVRTLRDEITSARTGNVILHAYRRVGGQVRIPEAVKLGKVATSV